jgi:hypothetical protein
MSCGFANLNKVGQGKYTKNGPNRKFYGWRNEGMSQFNTLLDKVRGNHETNSTPMRSKM